MNMLWCFSHDEHKMVFMPEAINIQFFLMKICILVIFCYVFICLLENASKTFKFGISIIDSQPTS